MSSTADGTKKKMSPERVYTGIFATSLIYAPLLSAWKRLDPLSYSETTWLQTVIGCGYILLWLRAIMDFKNWFPLCAGFFFGSIPIIARALLENGQNNLDYNNFTRR